MNLKSSLNGAYPVIAIGICHISWTVESVVPKMAREMGSIGEEHLTFPIHGVVMEVPSIVILSIFHESCALTVHKPYVFVRKQII